MKKACEFDELLIESGLRKLSSLDRIIEII